METPLDDGPFHVVIAKQPHLLISLTVSGAPLYGFPSAAAKQVSGACALHARRADEVEPWPAPTRRISITPLRRLD
jgi:hypothetical protein